MNDRQRLFVAEYSKDRNATKATIRAACLLAFGAWSEVAAAADGHAARALQPVVVGRLLPGAPSPATADRQVAAR